MRDLPVRWRFRRLPDWLQRLAAIGVLPSDSEELRLRKAVLVLSSTLMTTLAFAWVATYAVLGLWVSAAIPFVYQLASAISIYTFARTRCYRLFRTSQLWMSLVFPFILQWSLGGFANSSAVCLWGLTSPLGALLFVGARQAIPWFAAFVGLVAVSGAIDPALATGAPHIPNGVVVTFFALNVIGVTTTVYLLLEYFVRAREREQARSERLLLNVLPEPVATRLKRNEGIIADSCPDVTVLFADIVGFTPLSERLAAGELVAVLDRVFARWETLAAKHGVEKIKTIGDAYMVAGGIPLPRDDHAEAIAEMALDMGPTIKRLASEAGLSLQVRIGIDSGPVVAGVIGPREVHLRPLGRHGQHRQPNGIARPARHHPSHRTHLRAPPSALRTQASRRDRRQRQRVDDHLPSGRAAKRPRSQRGPEPRPTPSRREPPQHPLRPARSRWTQRLATAGHPRLQPALAKT